MDEFDFITTFDLVSDGGSVIPGESEQSREQSPPIQRQGSFASFICHFSYLESKLRGFTSLVLSDPSKIRKTSRVLGKGKTFLVRHAQWVKDPDEPPLDVALKEIILDVVSSSQVISPSSSQRVESDWKDILFEIRALLHEPIRYHPNLVRLLGLQWGLSPFSESTYPMLVMECSTLGTLKDIQETVKPLPFANKQKLCYDVARGLSALHACGIVHGDMKHENVLIYRSDDTQLGVPYTAKLADFGGCVMDMSNDDFRRIETWTWPFQAPEWSKPLSQEGMKLTDIYSFGLLVWRAFTDGEGFVSLPGASQNSSDEDKRSLIAQKGKDNFTRVAIADICEYAAVHRIPQPSLDLITYTIASTIRLNPTDRNLVRAQATLRGTKLEKIDTFIELVRLQNDEYNATQARRAPGAHGITRDNLQFMLGRYGESVDLQDNLPGYRPRMDQPKAGEYLFEPGKLKEVLSWQQQQRMVQELKQAAERAAGTPSGSLDLCKTVAAFYLFQCHLVEFGVPFSASGAVKWLYQAASDDESHEDADYQAQAWLWRVSQALGVDLELPRTKLEDLLRLSVFRGHRTSLEDLSGLASRNSSQDSESWKRLYWQSRTLLHTYAGAVGMGYFFPPRMANPFDLEDLTKLDEKIRAQLRDNYSQSLKNVECAVDARGYDASQNGCPAGSQDVNHFDQIYVNGRGHGLLHYAAATGNITALRHLILKYRCDIDLPNKHVDETPLTCACEGGKLDTALYLLEQGANANGYRFGQEGPLHWLCSFLPNEMETIASRLVSSGADIELYAVGMRHDVRGIRADWEHSFEITVTPLGRAVLMKNLDAVKILLKLGADPLAKTGNRHPAALIGIEGIKKELDVSCPLELAAILTLPEILQELLLHIDRLQQGRPQNPAKFLDEAAMLEIAHGKKATDFDPLTLQSRLVRCGANCKESLRLTLKLLFERSMPWNSTRDGEEISKERSKVLCREISLGNVDIVECLLELGYDANGTKKLRPLEKAIGLNHEGLFQLLVQHKADLKSVRTTPEGSQLSLLHLCACRPKQSKPGRAIVDRLIAAGLPLEGSDLKTRSPLVLAILNQNFDVAGALLEHGADVNRTYHVELNTPNGPEARTVSVFVELLSQHTGRSLESLSFLLGKKEGGPRQRPDFIVDKANKFSVLHLLAESRLFTEVAQITPQIMYLCVQTYSEPAYVNYVHPIFGSPLYCAAATGNRAMISLLLSKNADASSGAGPDVTDSVQLLLRAKQTWTPLWAAILRYEEEINKLISFPSADPLDANPESPLLTNLENIVAKLFERDTDKLGRQAWAKLTGKKQLLMQRYNEAVGERMKTRMEYEADANDLPIDLSVLSRQGGTKVDNELLGGPEKDWRTEDLLKYLPVG